MIERIALVTSVLGILSLLILSHFIEPRVVEVSEINENMIGQTVAIHANITSVRSFENMELLSADSLKDNSSITVVVFRKIEIGKGTATITGKLSEYHGQIEIEASEIKMD